MKLLQSAEQQDTTTRITVRGMGRSGVSASSSRRDLDANHTDDDEYEDDDYHHVTAAPAGIPGPGPSPARLARMAVEGGEMGSWTGDGSTNA